MSIVIDFSNFSFADAFAPLALFWNYFINGGWIVFAAGVLFLLWEIHMYIITNKYAASVKYVLLAIDVPRDLKPNLKAVEHIYSQLMGIASAPNWVEKYFEGRFQLAISLELVSIGGYIQFIIRTPNQYRDLVEAAIYAQYPTAEITEVEDYTLGYPTKYPNDKYNVFGSGIAFTKPNAYPIRTYLEFEHSLSQELADPMASLLEVLSKLRLGEQVWIQMVIRPPQSTSWIDEGQSIVKKIIGEPKPAYKDPFGPLSVLAKHASEAVTASLLPVGEPEKKKEEKKDKNNMMQLTEGEKNAYSSIQTKMSKLAFEVKFRYVYLSEKEVTNKSLGISAVFGALRQFASEDLNGFKPDKRTFVKSNFVLFNKPRMSGRQTNLMSNYKMRMAGSGIILNTEELATVFHFPTETVKAPMLKKAESKRGEPPAGLPIPEMAAPLTPVGQTPGSYAPAPASIPVVPTEQTAAPSDLPVAPAAASSQPAAQPPTQPPANNEPTAPSNLPFA
ncbi:MAG: hypothetical protein WC734_05285 [Patescibacteria group bacterium]|jgi:hypothetical protein